jgi:hypothetical protein
MLLRKYFYKESMDLGSMCVKVIINYELDLGVIYFICSILGPDVYLFYSALTFW